MLASSMHAVASVLRVRPAVSSVLATRHVRTVLTMVLLLSVVGMMMVAPAAAQCDDPDSSSCSASKDKYTSMLGNLFDVALDTLKYAGFIVAAVGAVLWFSARRNSGRAQTGVWLFVGGMAMIVLFFGFDIMVALLKWLTQTGGGGG